MNLEKWDLRFLEMAKLVSSWSRDPSTKCGAVITKGKEVISLGYNGFPKNMSDDESLYLDREKKLSRVVHCEMNAVIQAKQDLTGCTLYTYPFASCDRCCVHMLQTGINRFVFPKLPLDKEERWKASVEKTKSYLDEVAQLEFNDSIKKIGYHIEPFYIKGGQFYKNIYKREMWREYDFK